MTAYADIADLSALGIPDAALASFSDADKTAAIEAFSSEADGYFKTRYSVPLTNWPRSLRMHVARGAVYVLMTQRGMNPAALSNELIVKGYDDAISWFGKVARGIVTLPVETPEGPIASPQFYSSESRGL